MLTLFDENNTAKLERAKSKPLSAPQRKAVKMLAAGLTARSVADALGCEHATIINWKKKDNFRVALAEEIDIDADLHRFELKAIYGKAIYRVSELIQDKNPQIALQACKLAFEAEQNILRIAEETEMLKALESRMDALASNGIIPPADEVIDVEDASDANGSEAV